MVIEAQKGTEKSVVTVHRAVHKKLRSKLEAEGDGGHSYGRASTGGGTAETSEKIATTSLRVQGTGPGRKRAFASGWIKRRPGHKAIKTDELSAPARQGSSSHALTPGFQRELPPERVRYKVLELLFSDSRLERVAVVHDRGFRVIDLL